MAHKILPVNFISNVAEMA